jgi:hypothetical protein
VVRGGAVFTERSVADGGIARSVVAPLDAADSAPKRAFAKAAEGL